MCRLKGMASTVEDGRLVTPLALPPDLNIKRNPSEIIFQTLQPVAHSKSQTEFEIEAPGPTYLLDPYVAMTTFFDFGVAGADTNQDIIPRFFPASWRAIDSISLTWKDVTYSFSSFGSWCDLLASADCSIDDSNTEYTTSPHVKYSWSSILETSEFAAGVPAYGSFNNGTNNTRWTSMRAELLLANEEYQDDATVGAHDVYRIPFKDPLPIYPFRYSSHQANRFRGIPFVDRISISIVWKDTQNYLTKLAFNNGVQALSYDRSGVASKSPYLSLKWINRPQTTSPLMDKYILSKLPQYEFYETTKMSPTIPINTAAHHVTFSSDTFVLRGIPSRIWIAMPFTPALGNITYMISRPTFVETLVYFNGKTLGRYDQKHSASLWEKNTFKDRYYTAPLVGEQSMILLLRPEDMAPVFSNVRERVTISYQVTYVEPENGAVAPRPPESRLLVLLVEYDDGVLEISRTTNVLHAPPVIDRGMVEGQTFKTESTQHVF